jgi:hypothetical protein
MGPVDYGDYAPFGIDAISDRRKKLYRIKAVTLKHQNAHWLLPPGGSARTPEGPAVGFPPRQETASMKDFANACFPPETLGIMKDAMDAAVAELPDPVSSAHIHSIAETILRTAKDGETDPAILQRMALLELQITPRG